MAINHETSKYLLNDRRGFHEAVITAVFLLNNGPKVDRRGIKHGPL